MNEPTIAIVVPSYNEGARVRGHLESLRDSVMALKFSGVLCPKAFLLVLVDDGSLEPLEGQLAGFVSTNRVNVHLLRHDVNLGQGAALQTGIAFARDILAAEIFITMDSDGQHHVNDIPALVDQVVAQRLDIVFGNRFASGLPEGIPTSRLAILKLAALFERIITGLALTDAHNGFRCFNRKTATVLGIRQNRMAHATEFKQLVRRHRLRYGEAPVRITYSSESLRKGQTNAGSFHILRDLVRSYFFGG